MTAISISFEACASMPKSSLRKVGRLAMAQCRSSSEGEGERGCLTRVLRGFYCLSIFLSFKPGTWNMGHMEHPSTAGACMGTHRLGTAIYLTDDRRQTTRQATSDRRWMGGWKKSKSVKEQGVTRFKSLDVTLSSPSRRSLCRRASRQQSRQSRQSRESREE